MTEIRRDPILLVRGHVIMGFRRNKVDHRANEENRVWLDTHREELRHIGVSPEVLLSDEFWQDFLENGHLHYHADKSSGWSIEELNNGASRRLLELLILHGRDRERSSWLRQTLEIRRELGRI